MGSEMCIRDRDNSGDDCDDCAGTPYGDAVEDECGICNGSCSLVDVLYDSDVDIAGFQFNVTSGTLEGIAGGGAAEAAGFEVFSASSTVLGFSFSGAVIPAGSGVLTTLQITGDACLGDLVLTGAGAVTLSAVVSDCLTLSYIQGCTDDLACNFDGSATDDNG